MDNQKVELLAPAGSFDAMLVAFEAGADAVYISGKSFGARAFAMNFTEEEIKEAVKYAHILNKKIYVTINTLIFDYELDGLSKYIDYLYEIKVDALIVQDLGVLNLIKKKYPDFVVHASTQMSIYNKTGILNLKKLGVSRAILAREVPIDVVKKLVKLGMEIEIFVHGALCYAYSGNCLMSYAIGGRSGNRGTCAQPCRKKYTLLENGTPIVTNKSIISMKDLKTIDNLDQIIESGVTSLKIEGRMKSLEYVKAIVSIYRKKIDAYYNEQFTPISEKEDKLIKVTFNRGFTKGYLFKDNNILRTNYEAVNHQGIKIGVVTKVVNRKVTIKLYDDLNFNDGIRFKGKTESGAYVNEMFLDNKLVKFAPKGKSVTLILNTPCSVNDVVYKTVDAKLQEQANLIAKNFSKKRNIAFDVILKINEPMTINVKTRGLELSVKYNVLTTIANKPIDEDRIKEQVTKLNNSLFKATKVNIFYDNIAYFTIKELNELRRLMVSELEIALINNVERRYLPIDLQSINKDNNQYDDKEILEVVVSNEFQKNICENLGITSIYYNDNYSNRFESSLKQVGMIHNIGQILNDSSKLVPSVYMNITNSSTVELLENFGFNKVYLSTEVEIDDLKYFNSNIQLGYFIYGREDLMVSNQCFIASSKGFENKNCLSCIKNNYHIIDEYKNVFPVLTDINNCDVRILNYNIRNEIHNISKILNNGISKLLVIFTNEDEKEISSVIKTIKSKI